LTEKLKKKQGPFFSILFSTHTHAHAHAHARTHTTHTHTHTHTYKMKYHKTNDVYTLYTSLVLWYFVCHVRFLNVLIHYRFITVKILGIVKILILD